MCGAVLPRPAYNGSSITVRPRAVKSSKEGCASPNANRRIIVGRALADPTIDA